MTLTSPTRRLVGFGCLPFEIALNRPDTEWEAAVSSALEQIATINDVEIDIADRMLSGSAAVEGDVPPEVPDDNERPWFWPEPAFTTITFELTVPLRMQPELGMLRTAGAEQFRVTTVYGYHGPCTFVTVLDSDDLSSVSPSTAVGIVHRFLSRELERQGGEVRMGRVGPSPFHADAELVAADSGTSGPLSAERLGRAGYERIRFRYDTTVFPSIDAAEDALLWSLQHELQLYYYIRRLSYISRDEALDLHRSTRDLVEKHSLSGLKGWFVRLFGTASDARKLGLRALDLQTRSAQQADAYEHWIRETYAESSTLNVFQTAIRDITKESNSALVANADEVVRFVEGGRRSEFEVLMLSAATLLGGFAGGIAGLMVSAAGGS